MTYLHVLVRNRVQCGSNGMSRPKEERFQCPHPRSCFCLGLASKALVAVWQVSEPYPNTYTFVHVEVSPCVERMHVGPARP